MPRNTNGLSWQLRQLIVASLVIILALSLNSCVPSKKVLPPKNADSQPKPEVVIGTTQKLAHLDPAAPNTAIGDLVTLSVFQRLLVYRADGTLHPDAAKDCVFTDELTYRCILRSGLLFHNGDPVTAKDVEFSILRAKDLAAPGMELLGSLKKISILDEKTVVFNLAYPDVDFGKYLAMPSLSIVPAKIYARKELRPANILPIGSGAFEITSVNNYSMRFVRYQKYYGSNRAAESSIKLKFFQGKQNLEDDFQKGNIDILWRGLDNPKRKEIAEKLFNGELDSSKYLSENHEISNYWRVKLAKVKEIETRKALDSAWQKQRTWLSLIPKEMADYDPSFAADGDLEAVSKKISLTLSYDSSSQEAKDLAETLAKQAQPIAEITVVADDLEAQLQLDTRPAPISESIFWLSYYLQHSEIAEVKEAKEELQAIYDTKERKEKIVAIEKHAAKELLEIPIAVSPNPIYRKNNIYIDSDSFGPGKQFTLWGVHR